MPICTYCGESAGWFHDVHDTCVKASESGCEQVVSVVSSVVSEKLTPPSARYENWARILGEHVWAEVKPALDQLATQYRIPSNDLRKALCAGWSAGAAKAAIGEPMHVYRYNLLNEFYRVMGFTDREMLKTNGFIANIFSTLLWSVMIYGDPSELFCAKHPFNLKPNEVALMFFGSVVYSKATVNRSRQGGYGGLSVPLGHGIYYHFGGFKSETIDASVVKELDYGGMLIATKNIYFSGPKLTFRIPYDNVLSFRAQTSGIGLVRDNASATTEIFTVLEADPYGGEPVNARPLYGWFLYNITHCLAQPAVKTLQAGQ
jgi:hypothetical protein